MKNYQKWIMTATMAFSSISIAGGTELRSAISQNHQEKLEQAGTIQAVRNAWVNIYEAETKINVWDGVNNQMKVEIEKTTQNASVSVRFNVKAVNEVCDGIDGVAFLLGGVSSFAVGETKKPLARQDANIKVADLFTHYKGAALGAGLGVGAGHWSATSEKGLTNFKKLVAIPIPFMGGDFALGFTSCRIAYDLQLDGDQAEYFISVGGQHARETGSAANILDLPL
jgi:hypothetical protein